MRAVRRLSLLTAKTQRSFNNDFGEQRCQKPFSPFVTPLTLTYDIVSKGS